MQWAIGMHTKAYTTHDGVAHEAKTQIFKCPFEFRQIVYYVYKQERAFRKPRWVVRKDRVGSVWATNIFGVRLDSGDCVTEEMFDRLFTNKTEAIEFCLKKNQQVNVKVYNEDSWTL